MKKIFFVPGLVLVTGLALVAAGCQWDGGPLIKENIGTVIDDTAELSIKVKQALRRAPQTSNVNIRVTTVSDDTVRLSGFVSNAATADEAERVAGQVSGVRFVVNTLTIR